MVISYFFRKAYIRFLFRLIDNCLKIPRKKIRIPSSFSSLLLCHPSHLGDVILVTSLLPILKKTFPDLKIGMLVSSQSSKVIENHPLVNKIHTVDHWKLNRTPIPLYKKIFKYLKSRKQALEEIKGYEISIDCNFHFPNLAPLMWQAKIPIRIGYTTAGLSSFLTHPVAWKEKNQSAAAYFLDLLKLLYPFSETNLKSNLISENAYQYKEKEYMILHIGAGDPIKKWPKENWRTLLKNVNHPIPVLFTGVGSDEEEEIRFIMDGNNKFINLCNKLSWKEYISLIANAKYFIGVDSCGGHVAAAFDRPSLLIYSTQSNLFHPLSSLATILYQPTVPEMLLSWKRLLKAD